MRIVVQRTPVLEACKLAERAVAVRPLSPVLSNLLVRSDGNGCRVTALDQRVGVSLPLPARVEEPGQALIPARQLVGILKQSSEGELSIHAEPGKVWVRGTDAEFELRGDDPTRFPTFPSAPEGPFEELFTGPLCQAIGRTLFACGKEQPGNNLSGILWEREAECVRLVATDNHRLAVAELPAARPASFLMGGGAGLDEPALEALVPGEALELLARWTGGRPDPVQVCFRPRLVFFRSAGAPICAHLLEGAFPPWRKALPGAARYRLLLPVGPFLAGVRQAAVLRERTDARLLLRFQGGRVTLRSCQTGTGRAWVQQALVLPCAREPIEVAFNPTYLAELLGVLDPQTTVRLELSDADAPALFCAGEDYRHVLMPLRLA